MNVIPQQQEDGEIYLPFFLPNSARSPLQYHGPLQIPPLYVEFSFSPTQQCYNMINVTLENSCNACNSCNNQTNNSIEVSRACYNVYWPENLLQMIDIYRLTRFSTATLHITHCTFHITNCNSDFKCDSFAILVILLLYHFVKAE